MADLLVLPRPAESLQNGTGFSGKKLEQTGLAEKKSPQCHKVSSWQVRQSRLCQRGKEQSHLSRLPDRKVGESQGEREPHLGEKERGSQVDSTVKKSRFQGREGGHAKRISLGEVGGSMIG